MKGSLKLLSLFGIPIFLHWSFPLVFLWIAYLAYSSAEGGVTFFLWLSCLFILVFLCVVLHEFGHALTARRFGVKTKDIILSPIGGVARLEKLPEKPWHEFLVAIAGPMVNVFIFLILLLVAYLAGFTEGWAQELEADPSIGILMRRGFTDFILGSLMLTNLVLVGFNLIPAFPMDGGRILRSLLSIPLGRIKATQIATIVAQVLAVTGLLYSFSNGEMILGLICVFVLLTSSQENRSVRVQEMLKTATIKDIINHQFTRIYEDDPLQVALDRLKMGIEGNFLVFNNPTEDQVVGVLTREGLVAALKKGEYSNPVREKVVTKFEYVEEEMNLKDLYFLFQTKGYNILPVKTRTFGESVGKVEIQQLNEYLRLQESLQSRSKI
ncbi:MAG: site-2 protease family protein [Saprospiraceae bacterium]|nr:site-2 protease family protein [Saprospiraceae bacterium]